MTKIPYKALREAMLLYGDITELPNGHFKCQLCAKANPGSPEWSFKYGPINIIKHLIKKHPATYLFFLQSVNLGLIPQWKEYRRLNKIDPLSRPRP